MLNHFVIPQSSWTDLFDFNRLCWAKDRSPPHRNDNVRQCLHEILEGRILALNHSTEWLARSPNLTRCDFFLWDNLFLQVLRNASKFGDKE